MVFMSCVPHVTIGISGTPASAAMRTAPVLSSLISIDRLIVASGKMPTISPDRRYSTAVLYDCSPLSRSTLMWWNERIRRPVAPSKASRLAMKRTSRLLGCAASPSNTKST